MADEDYRPHYQCSEMFPEGVVCRTAVIGTRKWNRGKNLRNKYTDMATVMSQHFRSAIRCIARPPDTAHSGRHSVEHQ